MRTRTALYGRVSTDEQALHGDSLRAQLDALTAYAKENNLDVVGTYIDDGYSATNLKRPNLQRLLDDVRNGEIDLIIFVKIDRWSRGVRNYYKLQDVLDENKTHWKTIWEDYDTTTTSGRLQTNIMLTIAENESSVTSDRIKAVFKNKIAKGEVISGTKRIGYDIVNKKLVVNKDERVIVQDIFNAYERLMNITQLVKYCKTRYENITYRSTKHMLTNYIYIGWHVSSNYGIHENYCEPIISKEQFDRVQRLVAINAKSYVQSENKTEYIFSKIINCNQCGKRLSGNRRGPSPRNKPDYSMNVYRCQTHYKNHSCENNYNITEKMLERYLVRNVKKELEKYAFEFHAKAKTQNVKPKINVDKINDQLEKILDLYMDDKINKAQYDKKYEELNKALEDAKREIKPQQEFDEDNIKEFLKLNLEEIYWTLDPLEKRRLWLSIIKEIRIERNIIELKFL